MGETANLLKWLRGKLTEEEEDATITITTSCNNSCWGEEKKIGAKREKHFHCLGMLKKLVASSWSVSIFVCLFLSSFVYFYLRFGLFFLCLSVSIFVFVSFFFACLFLSSFICLVIFRYSAQLSLTYKSLYFTNFFYFCSLLPLKCLIFSSLALNKC